MKIIFVAILGLLTLNSHVFASSSRPACSLQLLCDHLKIQSNPFPLERQESEEAAFDRAQRMFAENKVSILELLAQKKESIAVEDFSDMSQALSAVTLGTFANSKLKKIFPAACDRPNAIFVPSMNQIFVCPDVLNFPELTLRQILAHEMGHVVQKMQDTMTCFKGRSKSQINEFFADWVASKVIAKKIIQEKNPDAAEKTAFESQLLFLNLACNQNQAPKKDWAKTHPTLQNRIEQIFLSQPAFQQAFRCSQPVTAPNCG